MKTKNEMKKEMEHKNPLSNPAEHTLQELFAELKFGRPSASQDYLDKCIAELNEQEAMKRTLIIYNTRETTQEEAAHLLDILNCDDSMIWDNADRCGVEIIEVPTDNTKDR